MGPEAARAGAQAVLVAVALEYACTDRIGTRQRIAKDPHARGASTPRCPHTWGCQTELQLHGSLSSPCIRPASMQSTFQPEDGSTRTYGGAPQRGVALRRPAHSAVAHLAGCKRHAPLRWLGRSVPGCSVVAVAIESPVKGEGRHNGCRWWRGRLHQDP
eukprot:7226414-Prymnesium_polylepis.1